MQRFYILILLLFPQLYSHAQAWSPRQDIPGVTTGRWGAYCFSLNNKIYMGGGYIGNFMNKTDLWEYDPASNNWTQKADVPGSPSRTVAVSFVINGKAYVGLGRKGFNTGGPFLADLWEYDAANDKWAQKATLPDSGRGQAACFVVNNKAYVVGGSCNFTFFNSSDVWEYDPANDKWTAKNDFPTGVLYAQAFTINDKGYVVGGNNNNVTFKDTWEYDAANDKWIKKADYCGDGRMGGVSFVIDGQAYLGSGIYEDASGSIYYNEFCKYNPQHNDWTPAWIILPSERTYGIAAVAGGKVFAGAGFIHTGVEKYFKDWYELTSLTGINETNKIPAQVNIAPNPCNGTFNVAPSDDYKNASLTVYDMTGRMILSKQIQSANETISLTNAAKGVYNVRVQAGDAVVNKRVVVE